MSLGTLAANCTASAKSWDELLHDDITAEKYYLEKQRKCVIMIKNICSYFAEGLGFAPAAKSKK